ncbi:11884_t:CDS:2 [Funneliformis geosporum]|uniref:5392_t:CDS:1 n=1 Tax=Funneliformis geosporum TaxID=1117311 RepID=A0A9W4SYL9_9GLOM|nr:5392_t:CDS:2 [Funneliformis geosporum]CAI2190281.1 11884_t:CDS:2 [Funneliformis geosporum]
MQKYTAEEIKEEIELDEDTNQEIDYISLFAKEKKGGGGIPKRGSKDFEPDGSEIQRDTLSNSLNALQKTLSEERNVSSRQLCKAIWHPAPISKAMITVSKGSHFHNMGHAIEGNMWLYPEECLFLMDRCSLSTQCHDVEMSIQHAYCEMIDGWLTLEKYQVYAYLKRIGFTVLRTKSSQSTQSSSSIVSTSSLYSHLQSTSRPPSHKNSTSYQLLPQQLQLPWVLNRIISFIISPFIYFTNSLISSVSSTSISTNDNTMNQRAKILVESGECKTYEQVYKKLQIIESSSITLHYNSTVEDDYNIDFLVYKESAPGKFKKKNPGQPLFHVVVASAETQKPPSPSTLYNLFTSSQISSSVIKSIIFAIVDGSNISFLEYNDISFNNVHVNLVSNHIPVEKKKKKK